MTSNIARILVRWRWAGLLLAVALAGLAYPLSRDLSFDRSIENMFAADDPTLAPFRRLNELFQGNEIVLVAYDDPELMTPAGYERVVQLTSELQRIDGVIAAVSISSTPLGHTITANHPAARRMMRLLEGYAVGSPRNGKYETAAVVCVLQPRQSNARREMTIDIIGDVARGHELPAMIAGEPVMVTDGFEFVDRDGQTLGRMSLILLAATILVFFRSIRWVLIPLAVIQWTLLTTDAVLVLSQVQLSMVSSMLTAIVTVISVATVIHVIVRFRDARALGYSPQRAMLLTMRRLAAPITLACATDAVGFAALLRAGVGPVQDFGLMMAIGALLVIPAVALLVPALALAGRLDVDPRRAWGEGSLDVGLDRLVAFLLRHPLWVAVVSVAIGLAVGCGVFRLQVETNFTANFRADSEIAKSYTFIESKLGGAGVMDIIVSTPAELDDTFLEQLRELQRRLETEIRVTRDGGQQPGLTKTISAVDALDATRPSDLLEVVSADKIATGLTTEEILAEMSVEKLIAIIPVDRLPASLSNVARLASLPAIQPLVERIPSRVFLSVLPPKEIDRIWDALSVELKLRVLRRLVPEMINALVTPDNGHFRVMLRAVEQAPADQKQRVIERVEQIAREVFPDARTELVVAGFYVLLTRLVDSMIRDQWICFGWAIAGIWLMLLIGLRNLILATIALAPNIVPIVMVMGAMGWIGLKINMGAAMIAAVSMGLSIDCSIHYLVEYNRQRHSGAGLGEAVRAAHGRAGRAMVFSTFALIIGFAALCGSEFVPTIYFGSFVSLSMLGGLLGNLVVLPVLLVLAKA